MSARPRNRFRVSAELSAKVHAAIYSAGVRNDGPALAVRLLWEYLRGDAEGLATHEQLAHYSGKSVSWWEHNLPVALNIMAANSLPLVRVARPGRSGFATLYDLRKLREFLDALDDLATPAYWAPVFKDGEPVLDADGKQKVQPVYPTDVEKYIPCARAIAEGKGARVPEPGAVRRVAKERGDDERLALIKTKIGTLLRKAGPLRGHYVAELDLYLDRYREVPDLPVPGALEDDGRVVDLRELRKTSRERQPAEFAGYDEGDDGLTDAIGDLYGAPLSSEWDDNDGFEPAEFAACDEPLAREIVEPKSSSPQHAPSPTAPPPGSPPPEPPSAEEEDGERWALTSPPLALSSPPAKRESQAGDLDPDPQAQALRAGEAFLSAGVTLFGVTARDEDTGAEQYQELDADAFVGRLPALLALNERRNVSVIVRVRFADDGGLILRDDLNDAEHEALRPFAFLSYQTSPGSYQAAIWIPGLSPDETRALSRRMDAREGTGNRGSNGATRFPGTLNRKPKHERPDGTYPLVTVCEWALGRATTVDALDAAGWVAPIEPEPVIEDDDDGDVTGYDGDLYAALLASAPFAQSHVGADRSAADCQFAEEGIRRHIPAGTIETCLEAFSEKVRGRSSGGRRKYIADTLRSASKFVARHPTMDPPSVRAERKAGARAHATISTCDVGGSALVARVGAGVRRAAIAPVPATISRGGH